MIKSGNFFWCIIILLSNHLYSQTIPYQAILRDNSGNPLPNIQATVTVRYFNNIY